MATKKAGRPDEGKPAIKSLNNILPQFPYTCIKCKAKVFVRQDHHQMLCHLYQERKAAL
jgi:hypothetical protein